MDKKSGVKRKVLIAVVIGLIISFGGSFIYNNYFRIDETRFQWGFLSRLVNSPNDEYVVSVSLLRTEEYSDITYIRGVIQNLNEPNPRMEPGRTVFWQRVETDSIGVKYVGDIILFNWVEVEWIDERTVEINGITVDINRRYDFRRDFRRR